MEQRKVLFLCTGNYYRSRFAEVLFNHLAGPAGLNWVADSRALNITSGRGGNVGPISPYAVAGIQQRGILLPPNTRFPIQVNQDDLRSSALIIALKEAEHRPLLEAAFPAWAQRVEYWHVHDLDQCGPQEALAQIEQCVRELVGRLQNWQDAAA